MTGRGNNYKRGAKFLFRSGPGKPSRSARVRRDVETLEPRTMLAADFGAPEPGETLDGAMGAEQTPSALHALFAPGTSADAMARIEGAAGNLAEYQATRRWSGTTSDGGGLGWGDATTLTWSIAPDGTSIPGFTGERSATSNLVSYLGGIYGSAPGKVADQPWFSLVSSVFHRWSEVSGLNFVYEPHDDGAAFSNIGSSAPGVSGVRGDIRLGGHAIDGASGTLAYTFFPDNGEMILDTGDNFFFDTGGGSLRLRNVLAHELGHGVGLAHVAPVDQTKLMEPYATTAFDGPQHDDILAAQRLYGDRFEAGAGNNTFGTAVNLGALSGRSVSLGDNAVQQYVSIDGATDVDYFRFTAGAGATLDAKLAPLGHSYQQGAADGATSSFNSKAQNDLTLEIYDANHQLVARADNRGLGGSESLAGRALAAGGEYFVRIRGDRDAAQLYQLNLTVSAGAKSDGINFYDYTIGSYGGSQDNSGSTSIESGGTALHLTGNRWKKIDFNYTVTPDTVLEFDFASPVEGDVHGIGFDSNTSISAGLTFRLYGTQDWGLGDFATYTPKSGVKHYVIPVGRFYTGQASQLVFVNDHDVAGPDAESIFSNVRVYESAGGSSAVAAPELVNDHIIVNEDSPTVAFNALANDDGRGAALSVTRVSAGSAGGAVSVASDGRIHYRPAADFNGTETFTYTAESSAGGASTATVTVSVRPMNDPPQAGDNHYVVTAGHTYRLNVLNNDSSGADTGETLTIVGIGRGSAGGRITTDGSRLTYTPAAGFVGTERFTYTINDGTSGSNATATVTVRVDAPASNVLDLRNHRIDAYGGKQDGVGAALVEDNGATLHLVGNTWKKIDLPYTITPDTVLEFDFSSTSQGDIHGIGLDDNLTITASRTFRLFGRQNWGLGAFDTYTAAAGMKHYVIPVGKYYTGPAAYLFFTNDHDVQNPAAESRFRNVRLYEAPRSAALLATNSVSAVSPSVHAVDSTPDFTPTVSALQRLLLDTLGPATGDHLIDADDIARYVGSLQDPAHVENATYEGAAKVTPRAPSGTSQDSATGVPTELHDRFPSPSLDGDLLLALDHIFASLGGR